MYSRYAPLTDWCDAFSLAFHPMLVTFDKCYCYVQLPHEDLYLFLYSYLWFAKCTRIAVCRYILGQCMSTMMSCWFPLCISYGTMTFQIATLRSTVHVVVCCARIPSPVCSEKSCPGYSVRRIRYSAISRLVNCHMLRSEACCC